MGKCMRADQWERESVFNYNTICMKIIILSLFIFPGLYASGQHDPVEITPSVLQKIAREVEKEVPLFEKKIRKQGLTEIVIEFSIDTFRIERCLEKRMELDYTTYGMNEAVREMEAGYDKLLNNYYNKLLKSLNDRDKKILLKAQKAWLAYRDSETDLIATMTKEEYSGGGSIQSNIATGSKADLTVKRALAIFDYYNSMIQNQ